MSTTTTSDARPAVGRTVARQSGVVVAQVAAGLGNLAFSVVAVRVLPSGHYAQFAAFLAAYLLINTPAASLTAGASLRPDLAQRLRPIALWCGIGIGALLAVAAPWLADVARLPVALVWLLALDGPVAGLLALARGHLFGQHRLGAAATAIITEPAVRCAVGFALLPVFGTTGAAVGVIAGGYAALLACLLLRKSSVVPESGGRAPAAPATVVSFLLLAVLGAQDVIVANRVLPASVAGVFAAVSTLGGAVLFATAMVPVVVLAQLRVQQHRALGSALIVTAVTSALGSAVLLALPESLYTTVLGATGSQLRPALPVYLVAMTLLCVARVVLAALCARGLAVRAVIATAVAAGAQLIMLLLAHTAVAAAAATAVASAVLLVSAGFELAAARWAPPRVPVWSPVAADAAPTAATEPVLESASVATATADADTAGFATAEFATAEFATTEAATAEAVAPSSADTITPAVGENLAALELAGDGEPTRGQHRKRSRLDWLRRSDLAWVIPLCAVALAVRLSTDRSVWIDEAISVHEASQPYGQMLHLLRTTDVHPPLYFTLLWATIHWTGSTTETIVRIPSIVPGILLVAVSYYAARDLWNRRTARFAGVIAVIGPAAVWYSQDARMYALFMLFATLAAWMLVRILRAPRWREVVVFTACCAALMWTQYDTFFAVATLMLIFVGVGIHRLVRDRDWRIVLSAVASAGVVAALCWPLIGWIAQQYGHTKGLTAAVPAQAGQSAASQPGLNAYSVLADGVWAVFGYHSDETMVLINALWPMLLLLVLASLGRGASSGGRILAALAIVPPTILFIIGQRRSDLFDLRYFSATVPALNLLLARLAASWVRGKFTRIAVPLLVIAALSGGLVDEQVNSTNPRVYDFRSAVKFVRAQAGPNDLLLFGPSYLNSELEYYRPGITAKPITGVPATKNVPHVFVLGSFLNLKGPAGQVGTAVSSLRQHRHLDRVVKFPNVTVWEFS
ncbi:MAG TPA: glycosyltransferase family 39 protein [Jatrophihabitantaceae bacterium]|nr:glycosyltransferase family 39 protein [Jatrophihabitantaceae bacterium]